MYSSFVCIYINIGLNDVSMTNIPLYTNVNVCVCALVCIYIYICICLCIRKMCMLYQVDVNAPLNVI